MVRLNISMEKLLRKIEEEAQQAKLCAGEARIRERIHAIKALCELILDEGSTAEKTASASIPQSISQLPYEQSQKIKIDEEANGDSLFDF